LTVLASLAFQELWGSRALTIADDDALAAVIHRIQDRLVRGRRVENPVDPTEDLNRIPDSVWHVFQERLTVLHEAAIAAQESEDEAAAALAWETAFSFLMPLPDNADELEVVTETGRALMQVPDIRVEVYDKKDGTQQATYTNEVPSVPKGRWLKFSIANPQIIPSYADVSWTVRNDGVEANKIGDLGHFNRGIGQLAQWEHTAYLGKHHMDCVIRLNGSIYAVRRVGVNIRPEQHLIAQAPRHWTRFRTRRGRRG
jgi:hypothetical protein